MVDLQPLLDLFDSPQKWTKGTEACSEDGSAVSPTSPLATRWCLLGGLLHCYGDSSETYLRAQAALCDALLGSESESESESESIIEWNDHKWTTFDDLRLLLVQAQEGHIEESA